MRKLTEFKFFKNTPFTQVDVTIHFSNNAKREEYFEKHYTPIVHETNFNFVKDNQTLNIPSDVAEYGELLGVNYCSFQSDFETGMKYYAYVLDWNYINDKTTEITFMIDPVMTYCQGESWLNNTQNVYVERQHLSESYYTEFLDVLKSNDDVLSTSNMKYIETEFIPFATDNLFEVIFQCSVDLQKPFEKGGVPDMATSKGQTYDGIVSPVNLYLTGLSGFTALMESLSDYPWISQNIKNCLIVPADIIDYDDIQQIETSSGVALSKFKDGARSKDFNYSKHNKTYQQLLQIYGIDEKDEHLLRTGYTNLTITTYSGQLLEIALEQLKKATGLKIKGVGIVGYNNEFRLYLEDYKSQWNEKISTTTTTVNNVQKGAFLDDCIVIKDFDQIPVLIDNYKLSWAQGASQRQFADSKTYKGAGGNVVDSFKSGDFQGALYGAGSIYQKASDKIGGVVSAFATGGMGAGAMATVNAVIGESMEEADYWKSQKADKQANAINTPSVSNQSTANSFAIGNLIYGITLKYSMINEYDYDKIKRYHASMGFEIDDFAPIDRLDTMSICNYLRFSGNWWINDVDTYIMKQLKETMKIGVKFYRDNGSKYPNLQNIINNRRIN